MKTIQDVKLADSIECPSRGAGVVIKKTKRTITIKFIKSTLKISYYRSDAPFNPNDL